MFSLLDILWIALMCGIVSVTLFNSARNAQSSPFWILVECSLMGGLASLVTFFFVRNPWPGYPEIRFETFGDTEHLFVAAVCLFAFFFIPLTSALFAYSPRDERRDW